MEQNTVKLTAKEVVKDQIASTLRHIDRRIAVISEKMNADYLHFFEWQAEEMFKVQKRRAFFTEFTKVVKSLDEDVDLTAWLFAIANRKSGELCMRRAQPEQLRPNGTSDLFRRTCVGAEFGRGSGCGNHRCCR